MGKKAGIESGERRYARIVALAACAATIVSGVVIGASLLGRPSNILQFEVPSEDSIAGGLDISGIAAFDRQSYFPGQQARFDLRVIYRSSIVTPELEGFSDRISHHPFEQLAIEESAESLGGGVSEYRLTYTLQVLDPTQQGRYSFDPLMLHYHTKKEPQELKSIKLEQPRIYISSHYPADAVMVDLFGPKGAFTEWKPVRRAFLLAGALSLLGSAAILVWIFGSRRSGDSLSDAEIVWRQHDSLDRSEYSDREWLIHLEPMFVQLFDSYAGLPPQRFWAGEPPQASSWSDFAAEARVILRNIYEPKDPTAAASDRAESLLQRMLEPLVEEARLRRENAPSMWSRLRQEPRVIGGAAMLALTSLILLLLCAAPGFWLNSDLVRYNTLVRSALDTHELDQNAHSGFSDIGTEARLPEVKAAAFYNAGTLLADAGISGLNKSQHRLVREIVLEQDSIDELIESLLLTGIVNSQEGIVELLIRAAESFRQAELNLELASRFTPDDDEVLRNLELVTKRKHAFLVRLLQLRQFLQAKAKSSTDEAAPEQGLVNIIDDELPEEYQMQDSPPGEQPYMIFERF